MIFVVIALLSPLKTSVYWSQYTLLLGFLFQDILFMLIYI